MKRYNTYKVHGIDNKSDDDFEYYVEGDNAQEAVDYFRENYSSKEIEIIEVAKVVKNWK